MLELAARVEHGQHDLGGWSPALLVHIHRDAAAIVADRAGPVGMKDDLDAVAIPGERLVHRVVHRLVNEVVQPVGGGVPDVHCRPLPDCLKPFQDLDVAGCVGFRAHAAPLTAVSPRALTRPARTSHHVAWPLSSRSVSAVVRKTCPALPMCSRTCARTLGSSSDSESSCKSTGGVPIASLTGPRSARRRAKAIIRCCPRDPKLLRSRPSSSITRSSR